MKTLVGPDVRLAVVLDRDYRSDEEVEALEAALKDEFVVAHVLRRKEIENYFLTVDLVTRTLQARPDSGRHSTEEEVIALLTSVTDGLFTETQSQCVARYSDFSTEKRSGFDTATLNKEALERFQVRWETLDGRLELVSGKDVLRALNSALQKDGAKALTLPQLASQMTRAAIPHEMGNLLRQLDRLTIT